MTRQSDDGLQPVAIGIDAAGLDPVQRARFSARLEEVRAAMPKKNKNTVADDRQR